MGKVSIISLGCPKNRVDSDTLIEKLGDAGFCYTSAPEDAEVILVNTCGFIEDAKRESIEEILKLKELKRNGKKLLVLGCLAQRYRDELIREIPEIDALWGVGEDDKIVEYCKTVLTRSAVDRHENDRKEPGIADRSASDGPFAYLKIAEGCNRGCTFCVIPSIRGSFRSNNPEGILRKAEESIRSGVRELVLVAQDISSYGTEYSEYSLPSLLKDLSSLSGDFWIRLLYLYPTAISDRLLSVMAEEHKICRYLDIPLQHSEDRILKAMGRAGTKKSLKREIGKIRKTIPEITLRTSLIVGFPGETEEDFAGLMNFVEEMRFERLGVFSYSREEGTPASKLRGAVSKAVRERRCDEIMRLQSEISLEKNRGLIGNRFRALIDDVDGGIAIARLSSQAPEIDGVVFIEGGPVQRGEFVRVRITEAFDYDLKGELGT